MGKDRTSQNRRTAGLLPHYFAGVISPLFGGITARVPRFGLPRPPLPSGITEEQPTTRRPFTSSLTAFDPPRMGRSAYFRPPLSCIQPGLSPREDPSGLRTGLAARAPLSEEKWVFHSHPVKTRDSLGLDPMSTSYAVCNETHKCICRLRLPSFRGGGGWVKTSHVFRNRNMPRYQVCGPFRARHAEQRPGTLSVPAPRTRSLCPAPWRCHPHSSAV